MSDIAVPSWRPIPDRGTMSWRVLAVAGGVLGVAALAGALAWGVSRGGPRPVPVIEADARPIKIRPELAGGMTVPNQDQLVLEPPAVRRAAERSQGAVARLGAGPESPALEDLRLQAAPPGDPLPLLPQVPEPPTASPTTATPTVIPTATITAPAPLAPGAAVAPALAPVPGGRAQIQLAALASEEAARAEWARLARRIPELAAFQPRITRLERDGQPPLFRLRTSGLADAAAARTLCEAVRARGVSCLPVAS